MAKSASATEEQASLFFVPFNLFYYFGFVPFRTKHCEKSNKYQLKTVFKQQIICVIFHIIVVVNEIGYFSNGILRFRRNSETNIVALFDTASNFSFSISLFLIIFHIRKRQQSYLQFLEYTQCKQEYRKCRPIFVYIVFVILSLAMVTFGWFLLNDAAHFNCIATSAPKRTAKQQESMTECDFTFNFDTVIYWGRSALYSYIVRSMSTVSFFVFAHGLVYMIALALGQLGTEFRSKLEIIKDDLDIDKRIRLYRILKRKTDFSRKLYGDIVLTLYLSMVTYYVQAAYILMGKRGETERVVLIVFTFTILVWVWAAQFHHSVREAVVEWITIHTERNSLSLEDRLKLLSIRYEVSTDPVALSCRCFCVTYNHICSMLGVLATYGVIVVQLNRD